MSLVTGTSASSTRAAASSPHTGPTSTRLQRVDPRRTRILDYLCGIGTDGEVTTRTDNIGDADVPARTGLIGRGEEMQLVRRAFEDGATGVLVIGPAGIGKTALARAAIAEIGAAGAATRWVRGTRSAAAIPLAAVADLVPRASAAGDPLRIFQASADALLAAAAGRRLVLAVDDAHLLDAGSAALVLHLAGKGAFVLATVRAESPLPDAVTALWKDDDARRLELGALTDAETGRLVERLLGGPVESVAARWAHDTSSGNALYIRELVREAADSGALDDDGGLWRLRSRVPPGTALVALVEQRLEGLGEGHRLLLAALGIGEPLARDVARRLAGDVAPSELEARGLVAGGGNGRGLRLHHPLYGEVAQLGLTAATLDELRLALAAETLAGERVPGDALRAATLLRDAGAPIEPGLLSEAAAEAYRARDASLAAELAGEAERGGAGAAATLLRGQALATLGRYAEAEAALAPPAIEPSLLAPPAAGAYLFTRINLLVWGLRDGARAERLVEQAAGWFADDAWRGRVEGLRLMVLSAIGAVTEAAAAADELAADPGGGPEVKDLLATSGAVAWLHAGRTRRARDASAGALPDPPGDERLDDRGVAALVSWSLTRLESGVGWEEVERRVARIERAAVRRGDRIAAGAAVGLLGYLALSRGTARHALRLLREAASHLELHDPRGLAVLIDAHIAVAAAQLGDAEQAARAEAGARARLGGRAALWHERPRLAIAAAWARAAAGERGPAAATLLGEAEGLDEWPLLQALTLQEALSLGAAPRRVAGALVAAAGRCDAPRADAA
ncbi:MAG TPA: AAA family ATPase, partial [Solirubrobacterales bacterium]|nr:AAA family ATPase [Solirubrobacterales bacterium]